MNYKETIAMLDEAWGAFEGVLKGKGFNVYEFMNSLGRKDIYNAVLDCAMATKPNNKNGEEE